MVGQGVDRLKRDLEREGLGPLNDAVVGVTLALAPQVVEVIAALQQRVGEYPLISVLVAAEAGYVVGRGYGRRRHAAP